MENRPAALRLTILLLAAAGALLLFQQGAGRFWLACGSFLAALGVGSLLLLLTWTRPNAALARLLRTPGVSLLLPALWLGLALWSLLSLF